MSEVTVGLSINLPRYCTPVYYFSFLYRNKMTELGEFERFFKEVDLAHFQLIQKNVRKLSNFVIRTSGLLSEKIDRGFPSKQEKY